MPGQLFLIPSFLGSENANEVFPELNIKIVSGLTYFVVEEERTARRFLKKLIPEIKIDHLIFKLLNEHTNDTDISTFMNPIETHSIGLISEAGVPCVADPGSKLVKLAHEKGIEVIPLVGPSSILLALMASGLNGQNFAFNGYLPIKKDEKTKMIKMLEKHSYVQNQSQLFIEAPYRNNQLLEDLIAICENNTLLCIACDLTLPSQFIKTASIQEWKKKKPDIHKRPAIFILKK